MEQLDNRFAKIYIEYACIFVTGVIVTAVIGVVVNNIFGILIARRLRCVKKTCWWGSAVVVALCFLVYHNTVRLCCSPISPMLMLTIADATGVAEVKWDILTGRH